MQLLTQPHGCSLASNAAVFARKFQESAGRGSGPSLAKAFVHRAEGASSRKKTLGITGIQVKTAMVQQTYAIEIN